MKKNRKNLLYILLSFLLFFLLQSFLFQNKIFADETGDLEKIEQKREEDFLKQLLLDIPSITDNPSHTITFIDPSEDSSGVEIEIDEGDFIKINSPFALPALSIGRHFLKFRFVDKYGSTQSLEKDIIIIPRPPIINSPVFEEESLRISGSGLSNSDLLLILSSERNILVKNGLIDESGQWEIIISNEELTEGVFTFSALTRRYGYASNLSEPLTFQVGNSERLILNNQKEIHFSFKDISVENIKVTLSENIDLVLLVGIAFLLGFALSLIIYSLVKGGREKETVKMFEEKMDNGTDSSKELTLKERLTQKEKKEEVKKKPQKEKEPKEEKSKTKTEKILTKVDFLKDYKKFDPDDEKGKEIENIDVKVTTKK